MEVRFEGGPGKRTLVTNAEGGRGSDYEGERRQRACRGRVCRHHWIARSVATPLIQGEIEMRSEEAWTSCPQRSEHASIMSVSDCQIVEHHIN